MVLTEVGFNGTMTRLEKQQFLWFKKIICFGDFVQLIVLVWLNSYIEWLFKGNKLKINVHSCKMHIKEL